MSHSANRAMLWTAPTVMAAAAAVGFVNGVGIVGLGISPIVMTLAMNGILQAAALVYCDGAPIGLTPPGATLADGEKARRLHAHRVAAGGLPAAFQNSISGAIQFYCCGNNLPTQREILYPSP